MLTLKQEKFAQNVANGMNQTAAYRDAYSTRKSTDNTVCRDASLLASNPKVRQRITELRDQLASPAIMTAKERLEWLTNVLKTDDTNMTD